VHEAVGGYLDRLAHDALGGEAAGVDGRRDVLDHGFRGEVLSLHPARVVHRGASGANIIVASGGNMRHTDCSKPCHGVGCVSTRPMLPTPLPP
jgi:hypothetical protein